MKTIITILSVAISLTLQAQSIEKFSIDSGGASTSAGGIQILYTIGEVNTQEYSTATLSVSEGFINSLTLSIKLNPSVFLQGPYDASTTASMFDNLRVSSLIPLATPYIDNKETTQSVLNIVGNNAIIDWVWVELRDKNDNTSVLEATSALLQRDGNVVSTDGVSPLAFNLNQDSYYVSIAHYNHLGIITATPIALAANTTLDLSTNTTIINGGINAVTNMQDGYYALSAGDFNGNGQVQNSDLTGVLPLLGTSAYSPADIDMNGQIQNTDINNVLQPNIGLGEQFSKYADSKNKPMRIIAPRKNN